jgi:hypothetical protein
MVLTSNTAEALFFTKSITVFLQSNILKACLWNVACESLGYYNKEEYFFSHLYLLASCHYESFLLPTDA